MTIIATICALALILAALWDTFETIILPRRVRRRLRLTNVIYRLTWEPWTFIGRRLRGARESALSLYGPLALLLLLAIWAIILMVGFALLQWSLGSHLISAAGRTTFGTDLYMSGTTFFTLGLGDVAPSSPLARALTVVEAGTGFAFLAMVIGYLPILYQAFSRREVVISLLDARAGSPPTAAELLRRNAERGSEAALTGLLADWERWSAELLESHLSYPSLGYFRSQHENQSWLASLTAILDTCALVLVGVDELPRLQARLTFAMARHAAVDLSQVFDVTTHGIKSERLSADALAELRALLTSAGLRLREGPEADAKLARLRGQYEPFVLALSRYLLLPLPPWLPLPDSRDDWETSPEE